MTQKRRILLAEFNLRAPPSREYAAWNAADKASRITVLSDVDVAYVGTGGRPPPWHGIRADKPLVSGAYYWETSLYSDIGLFDFEFGVLRYPGVDGQWLDQQPSTLTYVLAVRRNGGVYVNNFLVGSVGASIGVGDVLRWWVDVDANTVSVALNSGSWATIVSPYPISTLDLRPVFSANQPTGAIANFGADLDNTPFVYDVPTGARSGVYSVTPGDAENLYFSSEAFAGLHPAPFPFYVQYDPRISADQDVEIERRGSCWVWGGQSSSRRGSLTLVNSDGGLDYLIDYEWRNATLKIYSGYEGEERHQYTSWTTVKVDRIDTTDNRRFVLVLADPLVSLDKPLQPALYPDDQENEQLIGRPKPIVMGRPMYCPAVRLDTHPAVRDYDVHDGYEVGSFLGGLDSIAAVYDCGDIFDSPGDWTPRIVDSKLVGFTLADPPHGLIVCNPVGPKESGTVVEDAARMVMWTANRAGVSHPNVVTSLTPPQRMAYFADEPISALRVARQIMDSVCGWIWAKRNGVIDNAQVIDPTGRTPDIVLDETVVRSVSLSMDEAKGLTLRIAGKRNHAPHTAGDLVNSVEADLALKTELTSSMIITRTADTTGLDPISSAYAFAEAAPAQETLLQEAADIQAEANRVASLWRKTRWIVTVEAILGASVADELEPGQIARLVWPRYGFDAGKNFLVIGVKSRFFSRRVTLTLWG